MLEDIYKLAWLVARQLALIAAILALLYLLKESLPFFAAIYAR